MPSPYRWRPVDRGTDEYLSWGTHPRRLPPEAGGGEVRYDPPVSLAGWLECNPLVRMRPIRLEE